uniref:Uncharacterized protein n=1 Tax=Glossina pallidipes TaxID=7398 RepID=A0A1B0ADU3_GLOPL
MLPLIVTRSQNYDNSMKCFIIFCLNVLIYAVAARVTGQANNYVNPVPDSNESAIYNPKHHMYGKLQHSSFAHYPNIIETITPSINLVSFSIPRIGSSNLNYAAARGLNAGISQRYTHPEQLYNLRLLTAPLPGYHHSIPVHQSISSPIKLTHERTNNLQKFLPKPESSQNVQQVFAVASVDNTEPATLVRQAMKTLTTKTLPSVRPAKKIASYNRQLPNLAAVASSASPYPQVYAAPPFSENNHESNTAQEASDVPKQAISSNYKIEHLRSSPGTHLLNSGSEEQIHDVNAFTQFQQIQLISDDLMQRIHNKLISSPRKHTGRTNANTPVAQSSKITAPLHKTFH